MGSAALLDLPVSDSLGAVDSSETKNKKRKEKSAVPRTKKDSTIGQKENKRHLAQASDKPDGSWKRPKRADACTDFKEKSVCISEKSFLVESDKDQFADEELAAIGLTARQDDGRPNRRLSDFILHNEDGVPQHLEMLEIDDLVHLRSYIAS